MRQCRPLVPGGIDAQSELEEAFHEKSCKAQRSQQNTMADQHGREDYVWVRTRLLTGGGRTTTSTTSSATTPRRAKSSVTGTAAGADDGDKAGNDWGWVRSRLMSDGALEALALQSKAGATSAGPKKRLVVLISKGVSDRAQKTNQQRALSILAARKTPYEEVDGMDPTQKERREMLFGVSKIRGNYPQFFLARSAGRGSMNETTTYLGNYHWIHELNDTVDLPQDIMAANPDLETWDRVLGNCEPFEGGAGGGDDGNGIEMQICVDDEQSPHHNTEVTVSSSEIARGNIVMANPDPPDEIDGSISEHFADDDEQVSAGAQSRKRKLARYYPDDLITLTHLHEPAVVHCLRKRYDTNQIYTATGPILLAINPFKTLRGMYSEETMQRYFEQGEKGPSGGAGNDGDGDDHHNYLPPHVYGLADRTYRDMMVSLELIGGGGRRPAANSDLKVDQSILVSGESGAGKTVSTKFIMQYLAALSKRSSGESCTGGDSTDASSDSDIEQQVLQSNPILESFGNARTIRNDNSSRFGKFVQLQFSAEGALVGASIETYLLEKVRIITQSDGERNYHIFYELLQGGLDDGELEKYFLADYTAEDFRITSCSGTYDRRDGILDEETFADLIGAFDIMSFGTEERADVMAVTCALLHLSNLSLLAQSADESAIDETNIHLEPALSLLGLTAENLNRGLCYFAIQAGKEHHTRSLSKEKAEKGLEALVKALYAAVFDFLVARINASIAIDAGDRAKQSRGRNKSAAAAAAAIGVLDIFGFESFDTNSFEQLCINYTNEALQQQFNNFVLKVEQEEYKREGIEWAFVDFPDNQDCLDLIGKKGSGIIPILDDMCKAVGMTDSTFCHAIYQKCESHPRFEASLLQKGSKSFSIRHYAGAVEYDTQTGWVEKDRDEVPKFTLKLLKGSSNTFVKSLGDIIGGTNVASVIGGAGKSRRAPPKSGSNGPSAGKRLTVGAQFSQQLAELRAKIDLTSPHYARCIKPNDTLMPDHFDPVPVVDQLRCNGVIEAIRVSRLGYPQRFTHALFASRYRILGIKTMKDAQRSSRRQRPVDLIVQAISAEVMEDEIEGIQIGRSKVFLRQAAYDTIERLRSIKIRKAAILIQKEARRYVAERDYHIIHFLAVKLECLVRRYLAIAKFGRMLQARKARSIQACWRKYVARHQFYKTITSIVLIQSIMRKHKRRNSFVVQKQSATAIQAIVRRSLASQRIDNLRQIRETDQKAKSDAEAKFKGNDGHANAAGAGETKEELKAADESKSVLPARAVQNGVGASSLIERPPSQAPPIPPVDSAELISMQKELEQLRKVFNDKRSDEKNIKAQLDEIKAENSKLKSQADLAVSLQDENKEMSRTISSLRSSLAEKDLALNETTVELKVAERDLASANKSLSESKAECQQLKLDVGKAREKGDKSAEDLSQRYAELASITQAMLRKDTEIAELKAQHEKAILKKDKQIKKLQKEAEQEDATIFGLNRENADLKSELETKDNAAEEEIESLNATIAKLKKKAKKYDKLQDDTKTVYTNYVDELTALREVNEILRNDVERWEAKATTAEEDAKQVKEQSDMELKSFTNALERMEELRADTEQELVDARLAIADLEAEQRLCTCKFEREAARKPEPLNSWVIICPSLVAVIPSEGNS